MEIPLALEGLDNNEIEMICNIFRSGLHTMGTNVLNFENEFAKFLGVKHAVMVNSGSSANLLAFEVLTRGLCETVPPNSLIAVPAILWPTSIWPIIQLGYRALVIDTLPNSLEIDFDKLVEARECYGSQLAGAILIHPLGKSLPLDRIREIRNKYNMFIIEDTCESLSAGQSNDYAGSVGDFGTFSFYFSHHITTIEGGMVVTDNDNYADDLRSMRAHGWTRNRTDSIKWHEGNESTSKDFLFVTSGYNFRPMDFQGALGMSQLKKLPTFIKRRVEIATQVKNALEDTGLEFMGFDCKLEKLSNGSTEIYPNSYMAIPIRINDGELTPKEVQRELMLEGIHSRPILAGNFVDQPAGRNQKIEIYGELKNSRATYKTGFMLGNHHAYTDEQVDYLCENLKKFKK